MRWIGIPVVLTLSLISAPLAADGQQATKLAKIGLLSVTTPAVLAPEIEAFRQALRELGYVEGTTFVLEVRYGEGRAERLSALAQELVGLKVSVIVATSDVVIAALTRETQTIPIVMTISTDPVGTGFVKSLARPGTNVTGLSNISPELSAKRLELLREAVPGLSRVAVLWNPDIRGAVFDYKETVGAARLMGLELQSVEVSRAEDLDRAFSAITRQRAQALVLPGANPVAFMNRGKIATFAQRSRLPSMYPTREYVPAGGLMSYGPSLPDLYRHASVYVDKILKGAKPGDLPIEQPTKFELVFNMKTAKALGLTIPQTLILQATEVIE
jgi:putative tryptophan/tyrosine transport system substrate-binding protein